MNKMTLIMITSALVLGAVPLAFADETKADCESGQKWIGYSTTDSQRTTYNALMDNLPGVPRVNTCEGEQWDGQDQVSNKGPGPSLGTTECAPAADLTSSAKNVNLCMSNDLNADTAGNPPLSTPLGIRVSTDGSQVYIGTNIRGVGDAVVYQSVGQYSASCGCTTIAQTGVYLRDNTNDHTGTNVLATIISAARLTKGKVDESDCTQSQYAQSAADPDHPTCGRDNTAITLEVLP